MDMTYNFPAFRALLPRCRLTIYSYGSDPFWREVLKEQDVWVHTDGDDILKGSYTKKWDRPQDCLNAILAPENEFECYITSLMSIIQPHEIICWNLPTKIERVDDCPVIDWMFICLRTAS